MGEDQPLPPYHFVQAVASLTNRLPRLQVAVSARPSTPDAGLGVLFRPGERAPLYLAAVSLIDEVARETATRHREITRLIGRCEVVEIPALTGRLDTVDRACRWLYRLAATYRYAQPRTHPTVRAAVLATSQAVESWDHRAATTLGELLAAWPLRGQDGRPALCPGYPRTGEAIRCARPLDVVPDPTTAVPSRIQCRGGAHSWSSMEEWVRLGRLLAVATGRPAEPRRPSLKREAETGGGRA